MAIQPCSFHLARYQGAACHVYPAIVFGSSDDRTHLRVCPECYGNYLVMLDQLACELTYTDEDQKRVLEDCAICGVDSGQGKAVSAFVTTYGRDSARRDWIAFACIPHLPDLHQKLWKGPQEALQAA